MRLHLLATLLAGVLACIHAQIVVEDSIVPEGPFCYRIVIRGPTFLANKQIFKDWINRMRDIKTLAAQKAQTQYFLTVNWQKMGHTTQESALTTYLPLANAWLEARWRQTTYIKNVLNKVKPLLSAEIFEKLRSNTWSFERVFVNDFNKFYPVWTNYVTDHLKPPYVSPIDDAAVRAQFSAAVISTKADFDLIMPGVWNADNTLMTLNEFCYEEPNATASTRPMPEPKD